MHLVNRLTLLTFLLIFLLLQNSNAADEPLKALKNELLSYFPIVNGKVLKVEGEQVTLDKGSNGGLKKGQRVSLFEETVSLLHPVTGQVIGKAEKTVGVAEIVSVEKESALAKVIEGKVSQNQKEEIQFKIPRSKIKILFAQGDTEWAIGEAYYRELKDSQRFELIDAAVNIVDINQLLKDPKGADILLFLRSAKKNGSLILTQEVYWIKDSKKLTSSNVELSPLVLNDFRRKYSSLIVPEGHTLLSYRLSRGINRIAVGNITGKENVQILIASDSEISLYSMELDLKLIDSFKIPVSGDIIWFDIGDIDKDGIDEIVFSLKSGNRVFSSIVKWSNGKFNEISRLSDLFLRVYDGKLIGQAFSPALGFEGDIFYIKPQGQGSGYDKIEVLRLPVKANIYDFYVFGDIFYKWEDTGFLVVYDKRGVPLWRSNEPLGFGTQYEKQTGIAELSLGKWNVHSRIKAAANGIIVIEKKPLVDFVNISLLGYRSSKLKLLQWTGIGMEEVDITEEMSGEILDYYSSGDRLYVLVKPPLGINFKRILQGENPFETYLHVLSFKY